MDTVEGISRMLLVTFCLTLSASFAGSVQNETAENKEGLETAQIKNAGNRTNQLPEELQGNNEAITSYHPKHVVIGASPGNETIEGLIPPSFNNTSNFELTFPSNTDETIEGLIPPSFNNTSIFELTFPSNTDETIEGLIPPKINETSVFEFTLPSNPEPENFNVTEINKTFTSNNSSQSEWSWDAKPAQYYIPATTAPSENCPQGYRWFMNKCHPIYSSGQIVFLEDMDEKGTIKTLNKTFSSERMNASEDRVNQQQDRAVNTKAIHQREDQITDKSGANKIQAATNDLKNSTAIPIKYDELVPLEINETTTNPNDLDRRVVITLPKFGAAKMLVQVTECPKGYKWFINKCREIYTHKKS